MIGDRLAQMNDDELTIFRRNTVDQNFMDLVVNMLGFKDKLKNMKNQSPEDSSSVWRSPGH